MKVLFIDDQTQAGYYASALMEEGFEVAMSSDYSTLKRIIENSGPIDVIVQDVMFPVPDSELPEGSFPGLEFYKHYSAYLKTPPFVIFTSSFEKQPMAVIEYLSALPKSVFLPKWGTFPWEFAVTTRTILAKHFDSLFEDNTLEAKQDAIRPLMLDFGDEIKQWFSRHPERIRDLSPRDFERLVADILKDLGLDVELTKATRDGGVDIYAYLRSQVGSFLILVECKRYAADKPVGVGVIQRMHGIRETEQASKAMIVTTSYFSTPAKKEASRHDGLIDLKDYESLKEWLARYK